MRRVPRVTPISRRCLLPRGELLRPSEIRGDEPCRLGSGKVAGGAVEGVLADDDLGVVVGDPVETGCQTGARDGHDVANVREVSPGLDAGRAATAAGLRPRVEPVEDYLGYGQWAAQGEQQVDPRFGKLPECLVGDDAPQGMPDYHAGAGVPDNPGDRIAYRLPAGSVAQVRTDLPDELQRESQDSVSQMAGEPVAGGAGHRGPRSGRDGAGTRREEFSNPVDQQFLRVLIKEGRVVAALRSAAVQMVGVVRNPHLRPGRRLAIGGEPGHQRCRPLATHHVCGGCRRARTG